MRKLRAVVLVGALSLTLGCGGSSSSSSGGGSAGDAIAGCSNGTSPSPSGNTIAASAENVATITVDGGLPSLPVTYVNGIFTTVKVCVPGTTNCQSIDHVLVDTGSYGLRLLQGPPTSTAGGELTLSLPQQTDASGNLIAECAQFSDGITWGSVKMVDIFVAGERALGVPIQVIGDSNPKFATVPSACSAFGSPENNLSKLLANGIIGVGPFPQDCGAGCAPGTRNNPGLYYACPPSGGCTTGSQPTVIAVSSQVQNPVTKFAVLPGSTVADNNGVIMQLPSVLPSGLAVVSGSLVFGIGTKNNNGLGNATVYTGDPMTADITTNFASQTFTQSFIDSGSNGYFFPSNIPTCTGNTGFYCPTSNLTCSAMNLGQNGNQNTINFNVANADSLSGANNAFDNLAGPNNPTPGSNGATGFDWGLPFFYGRNVFTGIEGARMPAGVPPGPFYAY